MLQITPPNPLQITYQKKLEFPTIHIRFWNSFLGFEGHTIPHWKQVLNQNLISFITRFSIDCPKFSKNSADMKQITILLLCFCFVSLSYAQNDKEMPKLDIEVPTGAKPWTSLDFNNNPYNFQFAIVSDRTGGHRPGVFLKGIQKVNLLQPEFVMSVGDLIEGYTEDTDELNRQWNEFNGFIDSLAAPFFYVPGNHDITNQVMEDLWKEKFGSTYYSFVYGDVLFLCLNSEDQRRGAGRGTISDEQYDWVKKVLKKNRNVRWTLVFMHQPLWHQENTERWNDVERLLSNRPHTVYTGHEHRYVQEKRNNGNYFVLATTGGGSSLRGAQLGEFDHVVWITMTDEGPLMANLQLEGVWEENVVDADAKERIRNVLGKTALQIEPIYVAQDNFFERGNINIKITNDEDVPMNVKLQEGFSWDLNGSVTMPKLEIAPNSVEKIKLELRNRKGLPVKALKPFKLKAQISYAFEDMPKVEFPFTYYIKPEVKLPIVNTTAKTVDGNLADWTTLNNRVASEAKDDLAATFDLAYDEEYLYLAAKVQDNEIKVMPEAAPWTMDYIGFVIDNKPMEKSALDIGEGWYRESLYALVTPDNGTIASNHHMSEGSPEGIESVCKITKDGYVLESRIPMRFVTEKQGKDWETLRVNILIGDLDSADGQTMHWFQPNWRGRENRVGSGMFFRK